MAETIETNLGKPKTQEGETGPIKCETFEWGPEGSGEIYHIYLKSEDPRFKRVCEVYNQLHPQGYGMGVSTKAFSEISGVPLNEARIKAAQMIEQVQATDFLEKLESAYAKYLEAQRVLDEARKGLEEIMPGTTSY